MNYLTQAFIGFREAREYPLSADKPGLRDLYDWHQLVWQAFPGRNDDSRQFLTRVDAQERERRYRLLIVSANEPAAPRNWSNEPEAWQTRELSPAFFRHRTYRFQLRVNPTKRGNVSRKRMPLVTDADLHAWLQRKGQQHGFVPDMTAIRTMRESHEHFRIEARNLTGIHHSVNFDGVLAVTNDAAFQQACLCGIGSAKAFGFGLLALVPLGKERGAASAGCVAGSTTMLNTTP